jgi:hypothetical protein
MRVRIIGPLVSLALVAGGCLGGYAPGTPGTPGTPGSPGTPGTPGNPGSGGSGGSGGAGGGGGSGSSLTARQLFDANVAPVFAASCAGCHAGTGATTGPTFLGAGGSSYYGKLLSDPRFVNNNPADSLLLTKGAHEGPALTVAQGMSITAWLQQEVVERGASNLPSPPTAGGTDKAAAELQKFGNCMTLTDFNSTGMNQLYNQNVNGGDTCSSCHTSGAYVMLSADATGTFSHLKTMPYILKFAVAATNADGSFKDIIAANRFLDRGKEIGHPAFTLNAARATALTNFFNLSYTHYKAGNCPAAAGTPDGGI